MHLPDYHRNEWIPNLAKGGDPRETAALYAEEAARVGLELGSIVRAGTRAPGERPLWIVVASTNGVNLGDLVGDRHAAPLEGVLMEGTLHVPLALYGPSELETHKVDQIVELVDLMPTLLGLAGASPPSGLPGEDLLALEGEGDPEATAYAEFGDMLTLRQGDWTLSFRCFLHGRTSLDPELTERLVASTTNTAHGTSSGYHLHKIVDDPYQRNNLVDQQWPRFALLQATLLALRLGPGAPDQHAWEPEQLWELRFSPADGYW
jgi:arylsulfatase A-like enzyme